MFLSLVEGSDTSCLKIALILIARHGRKNLESDRKRGAIAKDCVGWKVEAEERASVTLVARKLRVKRIGRPPDRVTAANPDN